MDLLDKGKFQGIIDIMEELGDDKFPEIKATAYESMEDYENASFWYEKALIDNPHDANLCYQLSVSNFLNRNIIEAKKYINQAINYIDKYSDINEVHNEEAKKMGFGNAMDIYQEQLLLINSLGKYEGLI